MNMFCLGKKLKPVITNTMYNGKPSNRKNNDSLLLDLYFKMEPLPLKLN